MPRIKNIYGKRIASRELSSFSKEKREEIERQERLVEMTIYKMQQNMGKENKQIEKRDCQVCIVM